MKRYLEKDVKTDMSQMAMQEDWTALYYAEMNPEKRQAILKEHVSNSKTEEDLFREELWVARYGKRNVKTDAFVGYLMDLKYIAESGTVDVGGKKEEAGGGNHTWTVFV